MVRTQDFQSCNRGSTPRGTAELDALKAYFNSVVLRVENHVPELRVPPWWEEAMSFGQPIRLPVGPPTIDKIIAICYNVSISTLKSVDSLESEV